MMSLARYQTYGELPGRDAVLAIEARLRGEDIEQAKARTIKRHTGKEREEITRKAQRGMIEGSYPQRHLLERFRALPADSNDALFSNIQREHMEAEAGRRSGKEGRGAEARQRGGGG